MYALKYALKEIDLRKTTQKHNSKQHIKIGRKGTKTKTTTNKCWPP